jgi:hypothetical protein
MATIARFAPERALIRSYLSRMTPSLVINFDEASTSIARSPFLPIEDTRSPPFPIAQGGKVWMDFLLTRDELNYTMGAQKFFSSRTQLGLCRHIVATN